MLAAERRRFLGNLSRAHAPGRPAEGALTIPLPPALGSGLVARTLDLHVSRSAKNYAGPNCPTSACVYLFAMDPMWDSIQQEDGPGETDSGWAIGRDISYVRLYLMTLETAEHGQHLFIVAQDAPTPRARTAMTKAAAPLLASLRLPVGVSWPPPPMPCSDR